jgi:monovalent cation:H+ antiporter, CPA1 family
VIALFRDLGVKGRLRLLVEAESLFNDGVAAVFLALVLAGGTATSAPGIFSAIRTFAVTAGGGMLIGAFSTYFAKLLAGRTADHLVETALTTVVAYGSFLFAEQLHVSGVLATVTAGVFMANGPLSPAGTAISERGRAFVADFWEFVAFLANSLIFLLIGSRVASIHFGILGGTALAVIIGLTILGRALSVYPLCLPFSRSRWAIPLWEQNVLWWGGLRGALGLALALSLPSTIPFSDKVVVATFGVVAFSVLIQGLTMPLLLKSSK